MKLIFSRPPRVVFKKPPNLKNMIVRTNLKNKLKPFDDHQKGCQPCNKPRCGTCKIMQNSNTFDSHITHKTYKIKSNIDCNSQNVLYQLNCNFCNKQYIGQTTNPLRIRMTGHRFDIFHQNKERPISQHALYHQKNKIEECYTLKGIHQVYENGDEKLTKLNLRKTELSHQLILQTRIPQGLNIR